MFAYVVGFINEIVRSNQIMALHLWYWVTGESDLFIPLFSEETFFLILQTLKINAWPILKRLPPCSCSKNGCVTDGHMLPLLSHCRLCCFGYCYDVLFDILLSSSIFLFSPVTFNTWFFCLERLTYA